MGFIDNLRNALADFIEYGPNVEEGKRQKNVVHMPSPQTPTNNSSDIGDKFLVNGVGGMQVFDKENMLYQYGLDKKAAEVLSGNYGNGSDRIDNLRNEGYVDPEINSIQKRINSLYEKGVNLDDWAQRMRNFEDPYDYYHSDIYKDYLEDNYGRNNEDFADLLRKMQQQRK